VSKTIGVVLYSYEVHCGETGLLMRGSQKSVQCKDLSCHGHSLLLKLLMHFPLEFSVYQLELFVVSHCVHKLAALTMWFVEVDLERSL